MLIKYIHPACAHPSISHTTNTQPRVRTLTGKEIELDVKEDSELIGGITVKIGDWVLDSSLRGQLRRLKESFN